MTKYILKYNGKYKNNVMKKKKNSKWFSLASKKIGCSPFFLKQSITWSFVVQDGNHLRPPILLGNPLSSPRSKPPNGQVVLNNLRSKPLGGH
jgi:hypothetical protein